MKIRYSLAAALVLSVASLANAAPVTTSPGKSSVSVSNSGNLDGVGNTVVLHGQIAKGKAKTVLQINATVTVGSSANLAGVYLAAGVNLADPLPANYIESQCDTASIRQCTESATFWLDIDAAETASPGGFVGQPLNIAVAGGNAANDATALGYSISFSAQVMKK